MRWIILVALMVGCGGSTTGGGIDAPPADAPASAADGRIDGGGAGAVACGTLQAPLTCPLPDQACCDFAAGTGTDHCYAVTGGTCEGGEGFRCDGPEDCASTQRCCYRSGIGSTCTAGPDCAPGGSGGQILCHVGDNSPCAPNGVCCELHSVGPSGGSPFGACHVGACPL